MRKKAKKKLVVVPDPPVVEEDEESSSSDAEEMELVGISLLIKNSIQFLEHKVFRTARRVPVVKFGVYEKMCGMDALMTLTPSQQ